MAVENLHIKKIRVDNYKSLKDSEIKLIEGLNIIIGPNGAGKSNMLDFVFRFASRSPTSISLRSFRSINLNYSVTFEYEQDKQKNIFSYYIERKKPSVPDDNTFTHELTLNTINAGKEILKDKKISFRNIITAKSLSKTFPAQEEISTNEFKIIGSFRRRHVSFGTPADPFWISKPSRVVIARNEDYTVLINDEDYSDYGFFSKLENEFELGELTYIVKKDEQNIELIRKNLNVFLSDFLDVSLINDVLNQYTPIKKIRFNPNVNIYTTEQNVIIENLYIDFFVDNEWIPWSYLSDGTKRLFYLISECISIQKGLLLIEEPELGIHPHQLYKILDFLKEQSKEKQIIISTHSPLALDVLNEKELDRIIIAKYDNGTKFSHLSKAQITKAKKYMKQVGDLSTYWLHSDLEQ